MEMEMVMEMVMVMFSCLFETIQVQSMTRRRRRVRILGQKVWRKEGTRITIFEGRETP